jgi:hypothetical protein
LTEASPDDPCLTKAAAFALESDEAHARQAATGLYYATAAAILEHEGERLPRRRRIAEMARRHRLETRDPYERIEPSFEDLLQA